MPEVNPEHAPHPIAVIGWDGTRYNVIGVDAAFHVQVDVITAALAADAATQTTLALCLAQLQAIEDMRDALQSVATDRLIVRGEDQLFSFRENLLSSRSAAISGAGGYIDSDSPAAGLIWKVTNIRSLDATSPTTSHTYLVQRGINGYVFGHNLAAIGANVNAFYHGEIWLHPGDVIRVYFAGGLVADACAVSPTGYVMTLEA